ncbi:uncharacterized protein PRCAT00000538001 [Priceomyces carsonii]|nr:unnamed protein product [Priceomyces carsonii]
MLKDENSLNMVKVWMVLEVRQFIHASIEDVSNTKRIYQTLY